MYVKKKKSYAEVTEVYGEKKICEIVKKERVLANSAVAPRTARVIGTVHDVLSKMKKALNLWMEDMMSLWLNDPPESSSEGQ